MPRKLFINSAPPTTPAAAAAAVPRNEPPPELGACAIGAAVGCAGAPPPQGEPDDGPPGRTDGTEPCAWPYPWLWPCGSDRPNSAPRMLSRKLPCCCAGWPG